MSDKKTVTILLVEDHPKDRINVRRQIADGCKAKRIKAEIKTAASVPDALKILNESQQKFDAVIADSQLEHFNYPPSVGAAELALSIRRQKAVQEILRTGNRAGEIIDDRDGNGEVMNLHIPGADEIVFIYLANNAETTFKFKSVQMAVDLQVPKDEEAANGSLKLKDEDVAAVCEAILKGRNRGRQVGA